MNALCVCVVFLSLLFVVVFVFFTCLAGVVARAEVSIQDFACHLDTWGLLEKWSNKNLPTKDSLVFEFSEKHNMNLSKGNK